MVATQSRILTGSVVVLAREFKSRDMPLLVAAGTPALVAWAGVLQNGRSAGQYKLKVYVVYADGRPGPELWLYPTEVEPAHALITDHVRDLIDGRTPATRQANTVDMAAVRADALAAFAPTPPVQVAPPAPPPPTAPEPGPATPTPPPPPPPPAAPQPRTAAEMLAEMRRAYQS